jgi:hypothetical protein
MFPLLRSLSLLLIGWLMLTFPALSQKIYYVTPDGAGTKDGSSWDNAYEGTNLQPAIDAASAYSQANENQPVQVWVKAGLYNPIKDGVESPRGISFSMRNQVTIYGGFAGAETQVSQRPAITLSKPSSTTLSGNIGDPDDDEDNTRLIFENKDLNQTAVIDGFCIVDGNSFGDTGAGMSNRNCFQVIRNCCFARNQGSYGAGLDNHNSAPTVISCSFINNISNYRGCITIFSASPNLNPVFTNCLFQGNESTSDSHAGGVMDVYCDPAWGGEALIEFINCTFVDNRSDGDNAALFMNRNGYESKPSAITIKMVNCLAWNNQGAAAFKVYDGYPSVITANYCLFDASVTGFTGDNNLTVSTLPFESETSVKLMYCSPAVNAGDPASTSATSGTTDLDGNPRFYGDRIDIGALEYQSGPLPAPAIGLPANITLPILQNTPFVSLTVSGCDGGTVTWKGPNNAIGTGITISVPTSATGTLVYSATCTVGVCPSPPGSATVTVSPSLVSGSFDGFVYGADCSTFRGWAWDRNKINTPVSVDILDGPTVIASLLADVFRTDLQTAGKGNGKHAFSWSIPESLKDGLPHQLTARVSGSSFLLKDSPKVLVCQGSSSPSNKAPVPPSPTILIAPLTAQVGVPFSGTLVAFTDPEGQPLTYQLSGLPDGLSINSTTRVINGTPSEAGTFVLTYQATDPGPLTNSVSFPLTINPASTTSVTGSFEGYLDKVECGTIRGWVWDRNKPNTPVTVEFYTGSTVWGSVVANIYRADLKTAGKGNGTHGYSFTVPPVLKDNTSHVIYGRVQGSTYVLKDSGKPLNCPSPVRLSAETSNELQVTVLGNPVSGNTIEVEIRGAEGQLLRLQLTDASGRLLHEHQIGVAKTVEHQTVSVQNQPSGLLLLRTSTNSQSHTVKILKP